MGIKNKGVIEIGTKFSKLTVIKDRELLRINGRTIGFLSDAGRDLILLNNMA